MEELVAVKQDEDEGERKVLWPGSSPRETTRRVPHWLASKGKNRVRTRKARTEIRTKARQEDTHTHRGREEKEKREEEEGKRNCMQQFETPTLRLSPRDSRHSLLSAPVSLLDLCCSCCCFRVSKSLMRGREVQDVLALPPITRETLIVCLCVYVYACVCSCMPHEPHGAQQQQQQQQIIPCGLSSSLIHSLASSSCMLHAREENCERKK